eukprot:maker-scaffold_71-snap-gene-0.3-mRNA-1 protein AED:0.01 eAED:0.01 QI:149/1/1/1/0.5/0.66/3/519/432
MDKISFSPEEQDYQIDTFKKFIRYKTISFEAPESGEYTRCVEFLEELCKSTFKSHKVETKILQFVENKPILYVEIPGSKPQIPGILLNSHYDVVPIVESEWKVPAFEGLEKEGKIYGRGTQDMKSVCVQYIFALSKVLPSERTFFLTFVPDEEIGGNDGMGKLVKSNFFLKELKPRVGIAFDEGLSSGPENSKFTVFYGERMPLWISVKAVGPTGHGSRFIKNTAVEKLVKLANTALAKRSEEEKKLEYGSDGCKHCEALKLGDVLTLNLTVLQAGVSANGQFAYNVIPNEAKAGFDVRVPVTYPLPDVYKMLDDWTKEEGLSWDFVSPPRGSEPYEHYVSEVDIEKENCSPFWKEFNSVCKQIGVDIDPQIFPAGTDSRFLREAGVQAFGFSPIRKEEILLHEHNEYISRKTFLEGVVVYSHLFQKLGNLA